MSDETTRAALFIEAGQPDRARPLLDMALAADPHDGNALCLAALAACQDGQHVEGLALANRAVSACPEEEWPHRLASVALAGTGQFDESLRAAREAVRLGPDLWETHCRVAFAAAELGSGHAATAAESARRAVQLAPDEPDALFALGVAHDAGGRRRDAREVYLRVLARDPQHAEAQHNLAVLDMRRWDPGATARRLGAVLAIDPELMQAQDNLRALAMRFVRQFYWLSMVAFLAALLATAVGTYQQRLVVGGLLVAVSTVHAFRSIRSTPAPVRQFVRYELISMTLLTAVAGLSAAMFAAAAAVSFLPSADPDAAFGLLRLIGLANLGLAVGSRSHK